MHSGLDSLWYANFCNDLHNAFRVSIQTGDIHFLLKLTHFLVNPNCDVDVRIHRMFPQKRFDSKLQVGMRTAWWNADCPVDVTEPWRSVSTLQEISREISITNRFLIRILRERISRTNVKWRTNEHHRNCFWRIRATGQASGDLSLFHLGTVVEDKRYSIFLESRRYQPPHLNTGRNLHIDSGFRWRFRSEF